MRTLNKKLILSLTSALYVLISGMPLYADDTELFTGLDAGSDAAVPNVLFIIDTSGSMTTNVTLTKDIYNPATTYTGGCLAANYYWSKTGSPPVCGTDNQYIEVASFKCNDASSALGATGSGYYNGRLARYTSPAASTDYWTTLISTNHTDNVECQADEGIDGDGVDTTKLYPASEANSGPWITTSTDAVSWSSIGDGYTFYTGNYINYTNSTSSSTSLDRLVVVQHVLKNVIDSTAGINASLMRFDNKSYSANIGGYFVEPMQSVDASTRIGFKDSIDALTANGWTPLSESLYEAMLYYRGDAVYFGDDTDPATNITSVLDPSNTANYLSPIEFQCQKNFIVLLTDGDPTYDDSADTLINNLDGFSTLTGGCGYSANDCLDELAEYMYENDHSSLTGDQNIITYTIGFGSATDEALLNGAATKGGGKYFTADSVDGLTDAFISILTDVSRISTTFVSPAVSVNAFNRLTHSSDLYFALFKPNDRARWPGNLKKYKLMRETEGDPDSDLIVASVDKTEAVDPNTGFFYDTAKSIWSNAVDGDDVELGGAAENQPPNRTIYTFTGADSLLLPPQSNAETLSTATNMLHEDNDSSATGGTLSNTLLGLPAATTDADRIELIQWARGVDVLDENVDSDSRLAMGDPLHSEPQLVSYKGTNDTDVDITIYMTTNEGYLHAIDADDGSEEFAFVPKELLPNLNTLKNNNASSSRLYGLDGPMTVWHNDLNNDRLVLNSNDSVQSSTVDGTATDEHVFLYYGMRRGGRNYYAMDVTNRSSPTLKWKIEGGVGDFVELGQSWSKMTYAKIKFNGVDRDVLIFGGGYDTNVDTVTIPTDDNMGRAIFIVDADTGERLWWASLTGSAADLELAEMKSAIVADVTAFDSTGDGYTNRIYAADLAARIWRFDIDNENNTNAATLVSGDVFADLNGSALNSPTLDAEANNRHFYYQPDVAYVRQGSKEYFTIAIGSGYRSRPTNTVIEDRFYVLRDTNVRGTAISTTITENNLYDTTSNIIGEGTTQAEIDDANTDLNTSNGWYIKLSESDGSFIGEKVLGQSVTFNGILLFSSFIPVANVQSNSCSPSQGTSAAWAINLFDGQPVFNFDQSNPDLTASDRKGNLNLGGIPPKPSIIFTEDGDVTAFFGTLQLDDAGTNGAGQLKDKVPANYFQTNYWDLP